MPAGGTGRETFGRADGEAVFDFGFSILVRRGGLDSGSRRFRSRSAKTLGGGGEREKREVERTNPIWPGVRYLQKEIVIIGFKSFRTPIRGLDKVAGKPKTGPRGTRGGRREARVRETYGRADGEVRPPEAIAEHWEAKPQARLGR